MGVCFWSHCSEAFCFIELLCSFGGLCFFYWLWCQTFQILAAKLDRTLITWFIFQRALVRISTHSMWLKLYVIRLRNTMLSCACCLDVVMCMLSWIITLFYLVYVSKVHSKVDLISTWKSVYIYDRKPLFVFRKRRAVQKDKGKQDIPSLRQKEVPKIPSNQVTLL